MIRSATLSDKQAIFQMACEQAERYPLRMDIDKLKGLIVEAISSPRHFTWVSSKLGDRADGVLVGLTGDNLWAQRQNCSISLWTSKAPGEGMALLRQFKRWVTSRRAIKVAGMCPDLDLDPRILKLAERAGFARNGGAYLLYN